jgi:hypothetical protein
MRDWGIDASPAPPPGPWRVDLLFILMYICIYLFLNIYTYVYKTKNSRFVSIHMVPDEVEPVTGSPGALAHLH